jgi:hypothetical protein
MKTPLTIFAWACLCGFALGQDEPLPPGTVTYPAFKIPAAAAVELPAAPRFDLTPSVAGAAKPVSLTAVTRKSPAWKPVVAAPVKPIKPFQVKLLTRWSPVWGFEMKEMLDRIEAAENAGDTKTYEALTKTFTIWADSYLVKPDTRQKP